MKEHGLTFPVVLQKQWEVSREYAFFGTPVAYLIDEAGVIAADVAIGVDAVLDLLRRVRQLLRQRQPAGPPPRLRKLLSLARQRMLAQRQSPLTNNQ